MADLRPKRIAEFIAPYRVEAGAKVRLRDLPTGAPDYDRADAKEILRTGVELLAEYQERLAAQDTYGVLVILQAMDAAGKDGTIRHVMSGVNPQGVEVHSFKVPSSEDLDHDYLWRYSRRLPGRGSIGIFNRSYYEEVLVVRVHPQLLQSQKLPPHPHGADIWKRRFGEINDWEHYLSNQGFKIVKIFLNLSNEEQRRRFLARIDEPEKNWKFNPGDARERAHWNQYQEAYSDVLANTSTSWAPWYVVPADDKPFARLLAAGAIAHALIEIDPRYPEVSAETKTELELARAELLAQAPDGAPADPNVDPAPASAGSRDSRKRRTKMKAKAKRK
jgi:PPK2 family polyphosphate:nucleotide phosphotransferase